LHFPNVHYEGVTFLKVLYNHFHPYRFKWGTVHSFSNSIQL